VVTNEGGPRHLVVPGVTGYVAETNEELIERVVELARDGELRRRMGVAARERVAGISWDAAFELTYAAYRHCQSVSPVSHRAADKTSKAALLA
jgi:glycosyltransferase involved in cell wall biosynthesis